MHKQPVFVYLFSPFQVLQSQTELQLSVEKQSNLKTKKPKKIPNSQINKTTG